MITVADVDRGHERIEMVIGETQDGAPLPCPRERDVLHPGPAPGHHRGGDSQALRQQGLVCRPIPEEDVDLLRQLLDLAVQVLALVVTTIIPTSPTCPCHATPPSLVPEPRRRVAGKAMVQRNPVGAVTLPYRGDAHQDAEPQGEEISSAGTTDGPVLPALPDLDRCSLLSLLGGGLTVPSFSDERSENRARSARFLRFAAVSSPQAGRDRGRHLVYKISCPVEARRAGVCWIMTYVAKDWKERATFQEGQRVLNREGACPRWEGLSRHAREPPDPGPSRHPPPLDHPGDILCHATPHLRTTTTDLDAARAPVP